MTRGEGAVLVIITSVLCAVQLAQSVNRGESSLLDGLRLASGDWGHS